MRLLQTGQDGGTDSTLEVVDHHQAQRVGGQGLQTRLVDVVVLGPLLEAEHQGSHSVVQLGVAVEEVGVPGTEIITQPSSYIVCS